MAQKKPSNTFKAYDQVIRYHLVNSMIEFFLPHKLVIRQNAEATKLREMHGALAKSEPG